MNPVTNRQRFRPDARLTVLAICVQCSAAYVVVGHTKCAACGGDVRRLAEPIEMARLRKMRDSGTWEDLRTVRA